MMTTAEGWWGDYGPARTQDGPAPKGQKQQPAPRPAAPGKPAATGPNRYRLKVPKL